MLERLNELGADARTALRAEVAHLAAKWARRLQEEPESERAERLSYLTAAEMIAAELHLYAAYAARTAAEAGADYAELAEAAGLASRQIARHRWKDLAEVARAARKSNPAATVKEHQAK